MARVVLKNVYKKYNAQVTAVRVRKDHDTAHDSRA
jgi:hypothetical protein